MVHGATVTVWSPAGTLLLTSHHKTGGKQGQFSVDSPGKTLFDQFPKVISVSSTKIRFEIKVAL